MEENKSPALHIPREHQSAPAEHWADKEVAKAAEEIRSGQFVPAADPDADMLAVGLQRGPAIKDPAGIHGAEKLALLEETANSAALAQHPRVQEALARLEQEKNDAKTPNEMLEKMEMLHEMNERASAKNQWDGQGRWLGKDNVDMRLVNVLSPQDWLKRLEAVIGEGRIYLNRFAVLKRVAVLVPSREQPVSSLILLPGQLNLGPEAGSRQRFEPVATLQWPCGPEWMIPKFDEYGVLVRAKYLGWRTALLSLITQRVISEKQAHRAFPLSAGPAGEWYRQQLYEWRAREGTLQ
jgi:hypothetical protein